MSKYVIVGDMIQEDIADIYESKEELLSHLRNLLRDAVFDEWEGTQEEILAERIGHVVIYELQEEVDKPSLFTDVFADEAFVKEIATEQEVIIANKTSDARRQSALEAAKNLGLSAEHLLALSYY